jgi:hypothetical protein
MPYNAKSLPTDVLALLKNLEKLSGTMLQLSHKVSHEKAIFQWR